MLYVKIWTFEYTEITLVFFRLKRPLNVFNLKKLLFFKTNSDLYKYVWIEEN